MSFYIFECCIVEKYICDLFSLVSYVCKSTFSCIDVETQYTYIFFSLQVSKKREICFEIFYTLPYYVIRSKRKLFQKWHFLHNFSHLMTPPCTCMYYLCMTYVLFVFFKIPATVHHISFLN